MRGMRLLLESGSLLVLPQDATPVRAATANAPRSASFGAEQVS